MKKALKEEEYSSNINAGTFKTKEQAQSFLEYLREKYGFSIYNSYINGTTVVVTIEKSVTNDSYFYELMDAIKKEREQITQGYKQISESRLRKMIRKALINEMNANNLVSKIKVEQGDGVLKISFGKNGWGLSDEFLKIHEIIQKLSQKYNVYLEKCFIDSADDVYDFIFHYDDKHFND